MLLALTVNDGGLCKVGVFPSAASNPRKTFQVILDHNVWSMAHEVPHLLIDYNFTPPEK